MVPVMPKLTLHFMNARGQLSGLTDWLTECLNTAFVASAALLPLRDTDVIVKAGQDVIPEKGHLGYAPEQGLIHVTVDPDHPSLRDNPALSLERMLAHELHHSARWDGPGYGRTLGEALVSEGLAGHFAQEVFNGPPEPWESLQHSVLRQHLPKALRDWRHTGYSHSAWFFGTTARPRWLGYSLGYQMVSHYLTAHPDARASTLVHAEAEMFLPSLQRI